VQAAFEVDAALVARLVDAQHPDLAGPVTFIGNGWDNALFRLGERQLARLPRRQVAADLVANEQRWLPELAGRLGRDIPVPIRVGRAGSGYPWPWSIVPWFEGVVASDVAPDGRGSLALDLADFVARLHTTAPPDAPVNPFRGGPLASRAAVVQRRLQTLAIPRAPEVGALWSQLVSVPAWDGLGHRVRDRIPGGLGGRLAATGHRPAHPRAGARRPLGCAWSASATALGPSALACARRLGESLSHGHHEN
jgi:hypothetical protein